MLSPAQTTLHWERWNACAKENGWVMEKTRLGPDARQNQDKSIYQKLVWYTANQLALQRHSAVTAEDLRHASYLVATTKVPGPDQGTYLRWTPIASMKHLGNREFSRWLCLVGDRKKMTGLLIYADDITATKHWENPQLAANATLLASLRKAAPEAALRAIAGNAFGTHDWESLNAGQLAWLRRKVGEKQKRWSKPVEQPF